MIFLINKLFHLRVEYSIVLLIFKLRFISPVSGDYTEINLYYNFKKYPNF